MIVFNDKQDREIHIYPFTEKDAKGLLKYYTQRRHVVNMNERFSGELTEEAVKQYIINSSQDETQCIFLAIEYSDEIIGYVRFDHLSGTFCKSAEISFGLLNEFWRNKILEVAISEAVEIAFEKMGLVRIFYENYSRDLGSCYILMDCGFHKDGVLRSAAFNNGIMSDATIFSLLFSDVRYKITVKKSN